MEKNNVRQVLDALPQKIRRLLEQQDTRWAFEKMVVYMEWEE